MSFRMPKADKMGEAISTTYPALVSYPQNTPQVRTLYQRVLKSRSKLNS